MKSLIFEIIHEDKLSEENLMSITGGVSEEKNSEESSESNCGDNSLCNVKVLHCPNLACFGNG